MKMIERVAAHYRTPADEVATMKRLAVADREAAWDCFTAEIATLQGRPEGTA